MKTLKHLFAAFLIIFISCETDEREGDAALSNMEITAEGSDDGSGEVSVDIPATNPELVNLLTNGSSKTWYLAVAQPGHLGVSPAREGIDGDWWYPTWYSAQAFEKCGAEISDCFCDDELTFSVDSNGEVSYTLDNKGQTFFNVAHKDVVGGTADEDSCYDYDTSGTKTVTISEVSGNVPESETTGMQLDFSDGGFMSYYVGSSSYEVLSLSEDLLYVRTYDALNPDLAWYHRFTSSPATDGRDESLETIYTDLVWSDEFDVDGAPNPANWCYDLGAGGWGNGEAQTYTDNPENVRVEDGMLKITAKVTEGGEGAEGDGSVKHYYDDVTLITADGSTSTVEDFEGTAPSFTTFGGNSTAVVENPDESGVNTSTMVAESTKPNGSEVWAGSYFDVSAPIDLTTYSSISVKTWSPAVGATIKLKLENQANADENYEVDLLSTVAEQWETLTFDFSAAPAGTYNRIVLFFDFGVSPMGDAGYTSARIKSENLFEFTYGRVEIRAKLPSAGGTWPALWALGANFDIVGWPNCGEIDIMEHVGNNVNTVSSALHYPGNSGGAAVFGETPVPTATSDFHNYTVEWTPDSIKFVVDDELVHLNFVNSGDTPFNSDFFFIMNIAMGGTLGGTIDGDFTEDTMEVDYIRVYQ